MVRILVAFGTRPEYIKVKSLIDNIPHCKTLFTGQHTDLLKNITVDYKLNIESMTKNRISNILVSIMCGLENSDIFGGVDYVLVQGDTSSALGVAISAYNNKKKVIHLEAGLRTNNIYDPYPEEINRQMISRIASIHLCPTQLNRDNLLRENVGGKIYITGNTGLDNISKMEKSDNHYNNTVLVTMHRRDNHHIMDRWFKEINRMAQKYNNLEFVIPIHPNPGVQKHKDLLIDVKIVDPLDHNSLIDIVKKCRFIISDSGGLQEEASFLNKRIIICRRSTERPEILGKHGILCRYPEDLERCVDWVNNNYKINEPCPFGSGRSWEYIVEILKSLD